MCLGLLAYSKNKTPGLDWKRLACIYVLFFKIFFLFLKIISTGPLLARDAREGSESSSASRKQAFFHSYFGSGETGVGFFLNMVSGV